MVELQLVYPAVVSPLLAFLKPDLLGPLLLEGCRRDGSASCRPYPTGGGGFRRLNRNHNTPKRTLTDRLPRKVGD